MGSFPGDGCLIGSMGVVRLVNRLEWNVDAVVHHEGQ